MIFLRPPEKLTVEIKASGRYSRLDLRRNGVNLTQERNFYHHREIYLLNQTDVDDLGLYEFECTPSPPNFDQRCVPPELDFVIVLPGKRVVYDNCMHISNKINYSKEIDLERL